MYNVIHKFNIDMIMTTYLCYTLYSQDSIAYSIKLLVQYTTFKLLCNLVYTFVMYIAIYSCTHARKIKIIYVVTSIYLTWQCKRAFNFCKDEYLYIL